MIPLCPKCRALGLSTDCTERLNHEVSTVNYEGDDYELEVTVTFAVPVTSTLPYGPHEMATHMREQWISEEADLQDVVRDYVKGEFDLQVKPVFY